MNAPDCFDRDVAKWSVGSSEHEHRRFFDLLPETGMQAVARHDVSLMIEDAGGALLHVHQFEKTKLAVFMIEKKIDVGIFRRLATRR
jgi:hypothetical protein